MLVSSMDSMEGRILQAHASDNGVIIRKTKLCSFKSRQDAMSSGDLFCRYIASQRIGDTRRYMAFNINILPKNRASTSNATENVPPSSQHDDGKGKAPLRTVSSQTSGLDTIIDV